MCFYLLSSPVLVHHCSCGGSLFPHAFLLPLALLCLLHRLLDRSRATRSAVPQRILELLETNAALCVPSTALALFTIRGVLLNAHERVELRVGRHEYLRGRETEGLGIDFGIVEARRHTADLHTRRAAVSTGERAR